MIYNFSKISKFLKFFLATVLIFSWSAVTEAAITYVGGAEGSNGGDLSPTIDIDLRSLNMQPGDMVIVSSGYHYADVDASPGSNTMGYTLLVDLYANSTSDANFGVEWKIMGQSPDPYVSCRTSVVAANGSVCVAQVWRGVDPVTPFDKTTTTAVGTGTQIPDSPSISPTTAGTIVVVAGLGVGADGDSAVTAPSGYTNQVDITIDPGTAATVGMASKAWTSGAEDPAVWTNWTGAKFQSWAAATMALKPATLTTPTITNPTATNITNTTATLGANLRTTGYQAITARGTCWGTSATPTSNCTSDGIGTIGVFNQARTGLPASTLIYYRGYATNASGTSYSEDATFMTLASTPIQAFRATGGTITYSGGDKIHTFTASSTFNVEYGSANVEVLVVGGGGGGGAFATAGGGGAGGLVYNASYPVSAGATQVIVGSGGAGGITNTRNGGNGEDSYFGTIRAIGGGAGARFYGNGVYGGSGGGGGYMDTVSSAGKPGQGNGGGAGANVAAGFGGGGGGGAGGVGGNGSGSASTGVGGVGLSYSISGTPVFYAAGGGGGNITTAAPGGSGIGGNGGENTPATMPTAGAANTGSGGGGAGATTGDTSGGAGGSGIVIVSYAYETPHDVKVILKRNVILRRVMFVGTQGDVTNSYLLTCGTYTVTDSNGLTYGTVLAKDGRCWLDRNLGATRVATSKTDWLAYGSLFQWGRLADGHQMITWTSATAGTPVYSTTLTGSDGDVPNNGSLFIATTTSPYDWRNSQNNSLWWGLNGTNNPCPNSFRLPTGGVGGEWATLATAEGITNGTSDDKAFASTLKLPLSGQRSWSGGSLHFMGSNGYYWSSSVTGTDSHHLLIVASSVSPTNSTDRGNGFAVRCIKN